MSGPVVVLVGQHPFASSRRPRRYSIALTLPLFCAAACGQPQSRPQSPAAAARARSTEQTTGTDQTATQPPPPPALASAPASSTLTLPMQSDEFVITANRDERSPSIVHLR